MTQVWSVSLENKSTMAKLVHAGTPCWITTHPEPFKITMALFYLWLFLEVAALVLPPQLDDYNLNAKQPACSYDNCSIPVMWSLLVIFVIFTTGVWQANSMGDQ